MPHVLKVIVLVISVLYSQTHSAPQAAKVTDFYAKVLEPLPNLPWKPSRIGDKIIPFPLK